MRLASIVLCLMCLLFSQRRVDAATGNTNGIGAWLEPEGHTVTLVFGGDTSTTLGTNLMFYNGFLRSFATNFTALTGTQTCTLTVASSGWTSAGLTQAVQRTLVATQIRRMPYPSETTNWVLNYDDPGTNIYVRLALSSPDGGEGYVYAGEVVTLSMEPGAIVNTNTGVQAARITGLSVTNLTRLTFALDSEPTVNWIHPGQQRWTNAVEYVYLDGGHWSGIAGVQVRAIDANSNTQWVWASHSSVRIDGGYPHGFWVAGIPTSTFTNLDRIRVDYVVYPMIGTNTFDTRWDRWTGPTPLPSSQTNFWDRFNSFTNLFVVSLGGNDANGIVTNGNPANVHSDYHFFTFDAGWNRLAQTNFHAFGIAEAIGTGYGRTGITNWSGGSLSASNTARSWSIIRNYPGDVLTLTNRTGDTDISDCVKLEGDTFAGGNLVLGFGSGVSAPFNGIARMWWDNIRWDAASTIVVNSCPHVTVTRCGGGTFPQGFTFVNSSDTTTFAIFRDVELSGINTRVVVWTASGIRRQGATNVSFSIRNTFTGFHSTPMAAHTILTDFELLGCGGGGNAAPLLFGGSLVSPTNDTLHGMWVENGFVESTNNPSSILTSLWETGFGTNINIKNLTIVGLRSLLFYQGTTNHLRSPIHIHNNIWQVAGMANDLVAQANPAWTNNVNLMYQAACSGNVYWFPEGSTSHNWPDFDGIDNIIPGVSGTKLSTNFMRFQNPQFWLTGPRLGGGDCRLRNDNYLFHIPGVGELRTYQPDKGFDLEGKPRSAIDPPGAYVAGNPKKRALF